MISPNDSAALRRSAAIAAIVVSPAAAEMRRPWAVLAAWGASGAAHAAVLALASFWGASSAQFDSPPPGASAISLRARQATRQTIVVEPVVAPQSPTTQSPPAANITASAQTSPSTIRQTLQPRKVAVSRNGKLPPAPGVADDFSPPGGALAARPTPPDLTRTARYELPPTHATAATSPAPPRAAPVQPHRQFVNTVDPHSIPAVESLAATGADSPPRPLASGNESPVYPPQAFLQRIEGTVIVRARISSRGDVAAARVRDTSGFEILDREALRAVQRWRFEPARRGGVAVSQTVDLPIRFYLAD